jgi:hypothetical protein
MEGRSMIVGAFALAAYSRAVCVLIKKRTISFLTATMLALVVWFAVAWELPRSSSESDDCSNGKR